MQFPQTVLQIGCNGKCTGIGVTWSYDDIVVMFFINYVPLGKSHGMSEIPFSHCQVGIIMLIVLEGLWQTLTVGTAPIPHVVPKV